MKFAGNLSTRLIACSQNRGGKRTKENVMNISGSIFGASIDFKSTFSLMFLMVFSFGASNFEILKILFRSNENGTEFFVEKHSL